MTIEERLAFVKRRLDHCHRKVAEYRELYKDKNETDDLTYHAGWNLGYWTGRIYAYEGEETFLEELIANR